MPTYRIIEIILDNQFVFIRREKSGSSTIGGDMNPPYPQHVVQSHFQKMLGHNNTKMDRAAANAKIICVNILHQITGTEEDADKVKKQEISNAKISGKYQVINQR